MDTHPFPMEDFLASVTAALKIKGDALSITIVVESQGRFEHVTQDWGVDYWLLRLTLPLHIFHALGAEEIERAQTSIQEVAQSFFASLPGDSLGQVVVGPSVVKATDGWREDGLRFVRGEGVTNQGRVRSDNIAAKPHRGLLFRSQPEITLFEALQRAQLAVAPLPVFVRVGKSYHRLEPDFVVVFKGLTFVIEVDGDTYHHETPAEADKRLIPLTYEGVEVRRIRAADLATDSQADAAVRDLKDFMTQRKAAR